MIEKLSKDDIGILIAAAVMALGAFCPLVRMPIVGSMNYVAGGRGDGIFIVAGAIAIVPCVTFGYRRVAGLIAAGALVMSLLLLVKFSNLLASAPIWNGKGPFGSLETMLVQSVGFEWGWFLLIGGSFGATFLAFLAPFEPRLAKVPASAQISSPNADGSFSSADKIIAEYLENRKLSPALRNESATQPATFGKRR